MSESLAPLADEFRNAYAKVRQEIHKVVVGHEDVVHGVLTCLFAGGHALLEGVPGLGKTLLVKTLSEVMDLPFKRIQFTPDLMPADIIGTNVIQTDDKGNRSFAFQQGPIFAQIVLADEINRATPKTQSALLEAMQEHSVTVGGTIHRLDEPFFVMATQNPIEQEGTYPLPEAQLDRFFFKLVVDYSTRDEIATIIDRTTGGVTPKPEQVLTGDDIRRFHKVVREILVAPAVRDYAVRLVLATHPGGEFAAPITNQYIRVGASPRGAQSIIMAAKVRALVDGQYNVGFDHVRRAAIPALRHRILPNFEAQAESIASDTILQQILEKTPERLEAARV
jgi:MoxR-like ATPase